MGLRPVRDFLLVELLEVESVSVGGIVLPESSKKGSLRGRVVRVGDGRWNGQHQVFNGFSCNVGDLVLFNEFAGFDVTVDGRELRLLRDADLIGVFEE